MRTREIFWIILALASSCKLFGATAAAELNGWEKLNLSSINIEGTTVYYEESLEEKLPAFERLYKEYHNQIQNQDKVLADEEKIIADIHEIVGPTELYLQKQIKSMTAIMSVLSVENQPFYLVKKETVKDYLRRGGKLPCMTYDKETDTVTYYFGITGQSKNSKATIRDYFSSENKLDVLIPIDSEETFEKDVEEYFGVLAGSFRIGVLLHELIETAILNRWKPQDPYWRWFSDGFANAITIEILKKYSGDENAEEFAKAYDVNEYKKLEKEINLRYWMGLNFCIKTPLEYESELRMARYTYATYEAQRLIEKHGFDCVRKILDEVCSKKTRTGQDILQAIKKATGEDMEARLARYQTFDSRKEGQTKYLKLFKKAAGPIDLEQMLINALRTLELQSNQYSPESLRERKMVSEILFYLGYEEAGDEAMLSFLEQLKESAPEELYDFFSAGFVVYALQCNNPQKAEATAERVLERNPDHPPALTVQMQMLANEGKLVEAKKIAQRICGLVKKESSYYKAASNVLAIDPNK